MKKEVLASSVKNGDLIFTSQSTTPSQVYGIYPAGGNNLMFEISIDSKTLPFSRIVDCNADDIVTILV
jgi:hypothetical protein